MITMIMNGTLLGTGMLISWTLWSIAFGAICMKFPKVRKFITKWATLVTTVLVNDTLDTMGFNTAKEEEVEKTMKSWDEWCEENNFHPNPSEG